MTRTVVAVTSDLLWLGKVRTVADKLGWRVEVPKRNLDVTEMLLDEETKLVLLDLHHRGGYRTHVRDIRGEGKHVFASNVLQLLLPSPRDRDCRATECEFARHSRANTTRSSDDPGDLAVQFHG